MSNAPFHCTGGVRRELEPILQPKLQRGPQCFLETPFFVKDGNFGLPTSTDWGKDKQT